MTEIIIDSSAHYVDRGTRPGCGRATNRRVWAVQVSGMNELYMRVPDHERKCNRRSVRPMRDAGVSIVASTAQKPEGVDIVAAGKGPDLLLMDVDPLVDITNTRHVAAAIVGSVFLDHRGMS